MDDQIDWRKKCEYLQREVASHQDRISDLEKINAFNRTALMSFQTDISKTPNKALDLILQAVQNENQILKQQIEVITQERNHALAKTLISEQISEAAERHEKQLVEELEKKVFNLLAKLRAKEDRVQFLEREQRTENGLIVKFKEVASVNEVTLKLQQSNEKMNLQLMKYYNQVRELTEQKDDLARLNFSLSNEIIKLQLSRQTPKGKQFSLCVVNGNDPNLYIQRIAKLQRHIVQDDSMDEGEQQQAGIFSPLFSPLPVKVRAFKQKQYDISIDQTDVPKLDLSKAKEIQDYNLKRLLEQQHKNKDGEESSAVRKEKIIRLSKELMEQRNRHMAQVILNNQLEAIVDELNRQKADLIAVNDTLTQSNKQYEAKWKQFYHTFNYYKTFYIQYKDQMPTNQISTTQSRPLQSHEINSSQFGNGNNSRYQDDGNHQLSFHYYDIDKAVNTSKRLNQERIKDLSFMDQNEEIPIPKFIQPIRIKSSSFYDEDYASTRMNTEQFKRIILDLAKEVYMLGKPKRKKASPRINIYEDVAQEDQLVQGNSGIMLELKRSFSNTLEYAKAQPNRLAASKNMIKYC